MKAQDIRAGRLFVEHALYSLSCAGAYFVLVEAVLFRRPFWRGLSRRQLAPALAVALLFLAFPPLRNVDYTIPTMGFLDKGARLVFNDFFRMAFFGALAASAALRFPRLDFAALCVWLNALLMVKAHIGWDKYALPLLVVLWHLKAAGALDADPAGTENTPAARREKEPS